MNAAARLVHQNALSRHLVINYLLTRRQFLALFLILSLIFTAISIIYVTHETRLLHANYQNKLVEQERLQTERSKLLLERSTWMRQVQTQEIAENKLGMMIPNHKSIVIIHE